MRAAEHYLEAQDGHSGPDLRAELAADPVAVARIALAIGCHRGQLPGEEVTEIAKEIVAGHSSLESPEMLETITECLLTRDVDAALEWLLVVGFIDRYLPELAATKDLMQEGGRRHKDVWEHTKLVVRQAVRRPEVRWGALLHDIGKVPTRTFTKNGVHFHGHAEVGARMFDKIGRRIPFPRPLRRTVRFLTKHHLRAAQYSKDWTDSAVRRFDREMNEHLVDLLDLSRADITSKRPGKRQALLRQISSLSDRIERLRAEDAVVPPLKPGIGNAIMERFALPPSKFIGDIKRAIEEAIESGELEERREDDYYLEWLAAGDVIDRLRTSSSS